MEELRTTEALDQEILEDARKKAFKILKTADDSVVSQARRWERRTQKAIEGIRKSYEQETVKLREEILARFPLDKRRMRSEVAESLLRSAVNNFLRDLKREDLLLILEKELEKRLAQCGNEEIYTPGEDNCRAVFFSSMNYDETESVLGKVFANTPAFKDSPVSGWQKHEDKNVPVSFPMIVLNTSGMKITASVDNAVSELLYNKRAELISTLLGEGALND